MTAPRLTIAIPSYNRASKLYNQLAWAVNAIDGRWDQCELLVSDNASPDNTAQVCEAWRAMTQGNLRVLRQPRNIGLVRNVLACISAAHGDFVWVVGDDDPILPSTFPWILDCLQRESSHELGYVLLNFSTANGYDGAQTRERVFPVKQDRSAVPGRALFEEYTVIDEAAMLLISANIYATEIVKTAITRWSAISNNLAFPLYLSGYAAAHGGMLIRAEPSLIYPHNTGSHLDTWLNTVFLDIPSAYLALLNEGYSSEFVRPRVLTRASLLVYAARFPQKFLMALRVYWQATRLKPSQAV